MSVVSKPLRRAATLSRSRSFYAAGAATLSIAAAVTAASAGVTEPAHAERPVAAAHTEKADNPAADSANPANFASASPKPTPAPAPVKVQPVAKPVIPVPPPAPVYPDNLDGWIRESLDILKDKNIPASYDGIYRIASWSHITNAHLVRRQAATRQRRPSAAPLHWTSTNITCFLLKAAGGV